MTVEIGAKYGTLTVVALRVGAKNIHPMADCVCDCGRRRMVRQTKLRRRLADCCSFCSHRRGWQERTRMDEEEVRLRKQEGWYRGNARRRGISWELSRQEFRHLVQGACNYCGNSPAGGIDRLRNSDGYVRHNSVSCCSVCNFAKRDLSAVEFLDWIRKVYHHAKSHGILQRHGSILLQLDQQLDGQGVDYSGRYQ